MLQIQFRDELSYQIAIHLGALCKVDLKIVATKPFVRSIVFAMQKAKLHARPRPRSHLSNER